MHDTGLITHPLLHEARAIVFGGQSEERMRETLQLLARIDQAHTVMLIEAGIIPRPAGRDALRATRKLGASRFADILVREPVRGLYMLYETALAEEAPSAADLHVGRSRNDLNAALFAMRCRGSVADLVDEILRLVRAIDASIAREGEVGVPVFSHRRPGMPGTWELYLSAVGAAVLRDVASLIAVLQQLDRCPLGAGAGGGTEIAIDPARTAALLGFGSPVSNALDAVASRDAGLRAVSAGAILASNLGRLAADLLGWYADHQAISLPDELVGASSAMPQKRNAFLLEHVLGLAGRVTGALTASLAACHGAPFANAVQVGTEAAAAVLEGLALAKHATTLSALTITGARPVAEVFAALARRGAVGATALALQARRERGLSFREAHRQVGAALRASRSTDPVAEAAAALGFDASDVAKPSSPAFGGGAADAAAATRRTDLAEQRRACSAALGLYRARWRAAERELDAAVDMIIHGYQET